jgi:hypothetical protein
MSIDWMVYVYEESGGSWVFDSNISRPNQDMNTEEVSNMQTIPLSTGENGFVTPETKYLKQPFQMFFANTTSDFRTLLYGYSRNGTKIKLITHDNQEFIGKITNISRVWFSGRTEWMDLQVTFTIMEN